MVVTANHAVVGSLEMELDDIANFGKKSVRFEETAGLCSDFEDFGAGQTGKACRHSEEKFW